MSPAPEPSSRIPDLEIDIRNILLVDDDEDLSAALKALLETRNFVVTTAGNGVEALQETMQFDFDAIICDLMMPTMPGDMFYRAVERTKPQLCKRFIFITGNRLDPRLENFLEEIQGEILSKPFEVDDLIEVIGLISRRN